MLFALPIAVVLCLLAVAAAHGINHRKSSVRIMTLLAVVVFAGLINVGGWLLMNEAKRWDCDPLTGIWFGPSGQAERDVWFLGQCGERDTLTGTTKKEVE